MKWLNISLFLLIGLFLISYASADTTTFEKAIKEDMSDHIKENFNPGYGVIKYNKNQYWFFPEKVAEYSLVSTTESIINIEMYGRATLYEEGILFDDVHYKDTTGKLTSVIDGQYYILEKKDNPTQVIDKVKETCKKSLNGTDDCTKEYTYKTVNNPTEEWIKYNKEILPIGDYDWKYVGKRHPNQVVDVIPVREGIDFKEWAWYYSNWKFKKSLTVSGIQNYLWTQVINVTYATGMQNDFGDIRFTTSNELNEYNYRLVEKVDGASAIFHVRISVTPLNSLYMYYGNEFINDSSNYKGTYACGDDFQTATSITGITTAVGAPVLSLSNVSATKRVLNTTYNAGGNTIGWKCWTPDVLSNYFGNPFTNFTLFIVGQSNQNGFGMTVGNATNGSYSFDHNPASGLIHFYSDTDWAGADVINDNLMLQILLYYNLFPLMNYCM